MFNKRTAESRFEPPPQGVQSGIIPYYRRQQLFSVVMVFNVQVDVRHEQIVITTEHVTT